MKTAGGYDSDVHLPPAMVYVREVIRNNSVHVGDSHGAAFFRLRVVVLETE